MSVFMTALDLFCGCGGMTAGLKNAGFRVLAAVDNDPAACATYSVNHGEVGLYCSDIRDIDPENLKTKFFSQGLDLMAVCAPCQPFSSQNRRKIRDPRSQLILQAVRFAETLLPAVIVFENVPGLAHKNSSPILAKLKDSLEALDYHLGEPQLVDAADYGVPQRRKRCVLFASLGKKSPLMRTPKTPEGKRLYVRDVFRGLSKLSQPGAKDSKDILHFAREHREIALRRLAHIPKDGGGRESLPPELCLACHKKGKSFPDVYGRMKWDDVAPTLTTGCTDITKGRFAHPDEDRAVTLREVARLQTFPDNFIFTGNSSEIARQIGNAVPVKLAEALGETARESISNSEMSV